MSSTQQTETPPSNHQGSVTISDFIRDLNAQARELDAKNPSEGLLLRLNQTIFSLTADNCTELVKIVSYLCSESADDGCNFLAESAVLFFRILNVCTVETRVTEARRFYLSSLLDHLCIRRANPNAFADIRNIFVEQSLKLTVDQLSSMLEIGASNDNTAGGENKEQWADIFFILFTCNVRMKKKAVEEPNISSSDISTTGSDEAAKGFIRFEIADVSTITRAGVFSPVIEVHGLPWGLKVAKFDDFLAVFLFHRSSNSEMWSIDVSLAIRLINIDGRRNPMRKYDVKFFLKACWGTDKLVRWNELIDEEKGFIKHNKITIEARFTLTNIVGIRIHPRIDFMDPSNPSHDVALIIEGEKIYVNKGLLAVHSDYFNTMFYGPFAEKDNKEIELNDVNREEFIKMLNLIYPSYEKITDDNFESLLKLADQYQIKIILDKIEQFLIESAKLNITRKLNLSDEYRLIKLQDHCLDSLKTINDIKDLKNTDGFKELSKNVQGTLLQKVLKLE